MDSIIQSAWRQEGRIRGIRGGGEPIVAELNGNLGPQYVWRYGRIEVVVQKDGDQWHVVSTSTGKLFGPKQVLHEARHKQMRHAAWDVMACAIRATSDEDQGVAAGKAAARWMGSRTFQEA